MADLYTLGLLPDSQGFTVLDGPTAIATTLDGGAPRIRQDQLNAVKTVSCVWTLNPDDYDYIMAFYRSGTSYGALPFMITLVGIDSSTPTPYQAQFVPGTFKLNTQVGLQYVVAAQMYVVPNLPDPLTDTQLLGRYS